MRLTLLPALLLLACAGGADPDVTTVADCDAAASYPDTVAWRAVQVPEGCGRFEPETPADPPTVLTTAAAFEALFECPPGTPTGVDFASERVAVAVFPENPDAIMLGAHRDGDRLRVQLAAHTYCGGAPPPPSMLLIALAAGDEAVYVEACTYGECDGLPRP